MKMHEFDHKAQINFHKKKSVCLRHDIYNACMFSGKATCLHFDKLMVKWEGEVDSLDIYERRNLPQQVLSLLPQASCCFKKLKYVIQFSSDRYIPLDMA